MAAKKKGAPKRAKQMEIPGAERPRVKEVETAAAAYVEARDARIAASEEESSAHAALAEVMQKHKDE